MSDFGQSLKLKYISKIRRFCEILWKDTGHFSPNNRTFRTFQNPDSQTWGSGQNSNTKPNTAIKHLKNRFQKCPKNDNKIIINYHYARSGHRETHTTFFSTNFCQKLKKFTPKNTS